LQTKRGCSVLIARPGSFKADIQPVRLAYKQYSAGFFLPIPSHIILFILPLEHY
jgi:hypothetical protein